MYDSVGSPLATKRALRDGGDAHCHPTAVRSEATPFTDRQRGLALVPLGAHSDEHAGLVGVSRRRRSFGRGSRGHLDALEVAFDGSVHVRSPGPRRDGILGEPQAIATHLGRRARPKVRFRHEHLARTHEEERVAACCERLPGGAAPIVPAAARVLLDRLGGPTRRCVWGRRRTRRIRRPRGERPDAGRARRRPGDQQKGSQRGAPAGRRHRAQRRTPRRSVQAPPPWTGVDPRLGLCLTPPRAPEHERVFPATGEATVCARCPPSCNAAIGRHLLAW